MEPGEYTNFEEIEVVVRKFETCAYGIKEFDHARHLAVAAWYVCHFSFEKAMDQMRSSLLRFTAHHGVKGYHETITRFWLELVAASLQGGSAGLSQVERVNELIRNYQDKNVLFEYYSQGIVMSEQAREQWLMPDRKALPQTPSTSLQNASPSARHPATKHT